MATPYSQNEKSTGLDALTDSTLTQSDLHIVGDVSDSGFAKTITQNLLEDYIANSTNFISEFFANSSVITEINTIAPSPLTTKGDLFTYSTLPARLPVGVDGQVLIADSGETTGLKWVDLPAGSGGMSVISQTFSYTDFATDGSGNSYATFTASLPEDSVPIGVVYDITTGFDATSTLKVLNSLAGAKVIGGSVVATAVNVLTGQTDGSNTSFDFGVTPNPVVFISGLVPTVGVATISIVYSSSIATGNMTKEVSISSAQIKTLNASPVTLIAAPGAGRAIVPLSITYSFTFGGVQYTLGNDVRSSFSTTTGAALDAGIGVGQIRSASSNITNCSQPLGDSDPIVANDSIILRNIGAEYATGNGTLKVFMNYKIINL